MKKTLFISALIITFILGIAVSDLVLNLLNMITEQDTFTTNHVLEKKIQQLQDDFQAKLDHSTKKYEKISQQLIRKEADMNSLIKEIDDKITPNTIKETLLTPYPNPTDPNQPILLNPPGSESFTSPITSNDPTISQFKQTLNNKTQTIINTSREILKEKVGLLNNELLRINNELKERNLELISKLKEVEQYKQELDEHKKYINDLEGIKSDLQKTVGILETKIENGRLKVSFKGDILFDSGKHQLRREGQQLLDSVFPILIKNATQNDIFIAGHTDNVPIKTESLDKYDSNWTLSTYRAIEVVKYLVEKGLAPHSLTAAGYGEFKPITSNHSEEGKSQNRRVELFIIPKIINRSNHNP